MLFDYYKKDARCMWCNRTKNPHPDYNEPIPTKIFLSFKKKKLNYVYIVMRKKLGIQKMIRINFVKI